MASNEYDDILSQDPPAQANEYDHILAVEKDAQKSQIQQNMFVASQAQPDRKAEVLKLADQMKMPPNIVERNFDDLKRRNVVKGTDYDSLIDESPGLAKFLEDPDHATLAQDDLPNLKSVEQQVQDHSMMSLMYNSLGSGLASAASGIAKIPAAIYDTAALPQNLLNQAMGRDVRVKSDQTFFGPHNAVAEKYSQDAKAYQSKAPELGESLSNSVGIATGNAGPMLLDAAKSVRSGEFGQAIDLSHQAMNELARGDYSRAARIAAAQLVANVPQQALIIGSVISGYGAVGLVGAGATSAAEKNAANLDAGIDPVVGVPNALATGAIESGFESIGTFGIAKHWENAIAKKYGRAVSKEFIKDLGKTIAHATAGESNEEFLTSFAQDFTDYASGVNPDAMKGAWRRAIDAGAIGGLSGMSMTAPSAFLSGLHRANKAALDRDFYLAIGESAQATKLRERMPEAKRKFIEGLTQGTPIENVYIPASSVETYFQSKKVNPVAVMQELGTLRSFEEAKARGGDVKIPLSTWVDKVVGTEHYQGLADDVRLSEEGVSVNEAKTLKEQMQAEAQTKTENVQDAEKMQRDQEAHTFINDNVRAQLESVRQQFHDRGQPLNLDDKQIQAYSDIVARRYVSRAEGLGTTPQDLFAKEQAQFGTMTDQPSDAQTFEQGRVRYEVKENDGTFTVAPGGEKQNATARIVGSSMQIESFTHDPKQSVVTKNMIESLSDYGQAGGANTMTFVTSDQAQIDALKQIGFSEAGTDQNGTRLEYDLTKQKQFAKAMSAKAAEAFSAPDAEVKYSALEDSNGGQVIDTDTARQLFEDYRASREGATVHTESTQAHAGDFTWGLYKKRVDTTKPKPGVPIMVLAGGTGVGKTYFRRNFQKTLKGLPTIVDTTSANYQDAKDRIEYALSRGHKIQMTFIYRDFDLALAGAKARFKETGRWVPPYFIAYSHVASIDTFLRLAREYARTDGVSFEAFDTSKQSKVTKGPQNINLDQLARLRYNKGETVEQATKRLAKVAERELKSEQEEVRRRKDAAAKSFARSEEVRGPVSQDGSVDPAGSSQGRRTYNQSQVPSQLAPDFQSEFKLPDQVNVVFANGPVGSISEVRSSASKAFKDKSFTNAQTGWPVEIKRGGLGKASGTLASEGNRLALANLDKLLENAIYARKELDKTGHDNSLHVFYAPMSSDSKSYVVKIVVRESEGKKFYDKFAIEKENPATGATPDQTGTEVAGEAMPQAVNITDFIRDVNELRRQDPYFQGGTEGARGRILISPLQRIIELGPKADFSTLVHESGHAWLDEMSHDYAHILSIDPGQRTQGQSQLAQDGEQILKWLGVESFTDIKTDHHEQFARGVEAYFMEGKAPTAQLRAAFARFKVWLINIYKNVRNLNVELSPEIKDVMARMITTQEEIAQAQQEQNIKPLFGANPETFGLTGDKAERYLKATQAAKDWAESKLLSKFMDHFQQQREAFYKEQWDANHERIEADVNASPIYRAMSLMQKGTLPDGTNPGTHGGTWKLSKEALAAQFDPDVVKRLPRGVSIKETDKVTGLHPDMAAELLGFNNGAEMINALANAEKKSDLVDRLTKEHMDQAFPDLINDQAGVKKQALAALHNEPRSKLLRMELEHLASNELPTLKDIVQKSIQRVPPEGAVKAQAKTLIAATNVGEVKPYLYLRAERAAAKDAASALVKGDRNSAFEAKRRELLNHELYKAALEATELVEKTIEKSKRFAQTDEKLAKSRDMDLINAGRAILSLFGLGKSGKDAQSYIEPIKQYDPAMYDTIYSLALSATQGKGDYKSVSFEDFQEMSHTLQAIWDLSKSNKQMEIDGVKRNRDELQQELQARLLEMSKPGPKAGYEKAATTWDKVKVSMMGLRAAVTRVETWVDVMDAGDPNGPFRSYIWQPISEAIDRYRIAKTDVLSKYLTDVLKPIEKTLTAEKIEAPELRYTFKSRSEMLAAMLHIGNESNMQKLLLGRQWGSLNEDGTLNRQAWDKFQDRMIREGKLTKSDFDYVQGVWDLLEKLKPLAQKAHKAIFGYYFNEITANEFTTPFGVYRGGYMPAVADQFINNDAALRNQQEQLESSANQKMFPTTGRGFTKAREQKYNAPLSLELALVPMHIDKVLRFSHIEPRVKEVGRLITDRNFNTAMNEVDSTVGEDMLTPWLERSAKQQMTTPMTGKAGRALDTVAKVLRRRTGLSAMVGNLTNAFQQISGVTIAALKVKPKHLRQGLVAFMSSPSKLAADVAEKSEYMRPKLDGQLNAINQVIEDLTLNPNKFEQAKAFTERHGYFFQKAMQNVIDLTVWTGAYNQAVENGATERGAVREADSAIRQTQDAQTPESVSRFETGSAFARLFTQYAGWFNMLGNLNAGESAKVIREVGLKKGAGRLFYIYTMGFMTVAVMGELIVRAMSGKGLDENDDDQYLDDFLKIFFGSQFRLGTAMFPGVGPVINAGVGRFTSQQYDDRLTTSPAWSSIENTLSGVTLQGLRQGNTNKQIRDTLTALSMFTGVPVAPLAKPITYLNDVSQGKAKPSGPIDFTRGLITGKTGSQK